MRKAALILIVFFLLVSVVAGDSSNDNTFKPVEKTWLKKIQNVKKENRSKILREILKKSENGEIEIRGQFRKELILLLQNSDADYEIEITNLLLNTEDESRNKEPIKIAFTSQDIKSIKKLLNSKNIDNNKEAIEKVWRMINLRANGVLQEEKVSVEIDNELLTEITKALYVKDVDMELKASEILQSENADLLKKHISPLLDSSSSTVKVRALLLLAGDESALDKNIDKVISLAKSSETIEVKDLAILTLCKRQDPAIIDAVKGALVDVTDVMNGFRKYVRAKEYNVLKIEYLKDLGFYLARKNESCTSTVEERIVDAKEIPKELGKYAGKNFQSYNDVEFVWDRLVRDSAGRYYVYPLYTRTDNRNYWHELFGDFVSNDPIIEIKMKMLIDSKKIDNGYTAETCNSSNYSLLLLVKNNDVYIVGLFQNKE